MKSSSEMVADKQAKRGGTLALIALCLGYFMVILDSTIVNVVAPVLETQLNTTHIAVQWVIDSYLLVFASLLLTVGALGDRLGNKGIFLLGLIVFTVASALCGLAASVEILIAARVFQGIGAALLVPPSLALLNHTFETPQERVRAIGVWGGVAGIAAATGPVVGGLLINWLGWRSTFLVNVPVGLLGFLLTARFVGTSPRLAQRGFDIPAQLAGIVALGTLTFAFNEGSHLGWQAWPIWSSLLVCGLAIVAFLLIERRASSPMLPLGLFSSASFSAANIVGVLLNFGFYGQLFIINLFFQQIKGYSPLLTGLALLPESGLVWFASWLSGRVSARVGPRVPMVIGSLIGAAGFMVMCIVDRNTPFLITCIALMGIGFGMSFNMPAMTTTCIESAPRERSSIASAVLNAGRQAGSALGVALLGSLVGSISAFIPGMRVAMIIAGLVFLIAAGLSFFAVRKIEPARSFVVQVDKHPVELKS
ncbi:DHA2 family efflux MFS transporter permease subunit [Ktedonosporobacter rubrisoli]|uniref:DHA2 family efflux MFS transporter permease subunit n=1 Tax=Ktedonosporobacter rubrisoli TaxID=2509675 RepID=A0A4P6JZP2_KTERU|nr:MFS transporter [Ktedonosporobacter rubrisoli]QBD81239.1 DHA2 family efflux MFS transporter permease subunit [Ktedonosporobacter rubrisoli]